jgi:hypothetical protein
MQQLRQIASAAWVFGTILIVLSWTGTVSPTVGWAGFAVALIAAVITWVPQSAPQQQILYPESAEGAPVAPTDIWVQTDTPLEPGSRVLAFSQGQWWRARVIAVEGEDRVRVNFVGWDPRWEESHRRSQLQLDADLPPLAEKPPETAVRPVERRRQG